MVGGLVGGNVVGNELKWHVPFPAIYHFLKVRLFLVPTISIIESSPGRVDESPHDQANQDHLDTTTGIQTLEGSLAQPLVEKGM